MPYTCRTAASSLRECKFVPFVLIRNECMYQLFKLQGGAYKTAILIFALI